MRALTSEPESALPTESFLTVLDQFAALHTYASATPAVGGYRVLGGVARTATKFSQRAFSPPATLTALAGARMRLTGFLSVLFIGGLGLAVLAGPANCPCTSPAAAAEQASLARLGYVEQADMLTLRETRAVEVQPLEPTMLSTVSFLDPEASRPGVSPITTSALEPAREVRPSESTVRPVRDAAHQAEKFGGVAETAPPSTIRLAAAPSLESDVPPTLPVVEVARPPMTEVVAHEAEEEISPKARVASRKRTTTRAYRAPSERTSRGKSKKFNDASLSGRSPKWAQQMFANPWQSQAFSYTR